MNSRFDMPSKDEFCFAKPALTQRCDCLLQFLIHTNLKEKFLCMRKGRALNAPNNRLLLGEDQMKIYPL